MLDYFIEREIATLGKQKIKIEPNEMRLIASIYKRCQDNEVKEYYKDEISKQIIKDYSKKFWDYLICNHNDIINDFVDICFHNQYLIDNDGIAMIYELDRDSKIQLDNFFIQMQSKLSLKEFIEDIAEHFEEFTVGDLQGVVEARCMVTKENDNKILNMIEKRYEKLKLKGKKDVN